MPPVTAVAEANDAGTILFAPSYPGACGWGPDHSTAVERLRTDVRFTRDWLGAHGLSQPHHRRVPRDVEIEITERVTATGDPRKCDSEGFFTIDQRPYEDGEVSRCSELLGASRGDVLELTADLDREHLDRRLLEGRRTIREILDHVAIAEHWYLSRVDVPFDVPGSWQHYPSATFARLTAIRTDVEQFLQSLTDVPEDHRAEEWTVDGERWTAGKVLRRLVWHELLHYKQLRGVVPKVLDERD